MNKFSALLLGSTALTFVAVNAASALTIAETSDFGDTFVFRSMIDVTASASSASGSSSGPALVLGPPGTHSVFGNVNSTASSVFTSSDDAFDFFTLTGLAAGQSVNISLSPAPDSSGTISSNPKDFAITLLSDSGSTLDFAGDSFVPGGSSSGSSGSSSSSSSSGFSTIFDSAFSFDATTLTSGNLNFKIESGANFLLDYRILVSPLSSASVDKPSSIAGLSIGAAGLGFIAARRRRRPK
jgi:hypothetical protein